MSDRTGQRGSRTPRPSAPARKPALRPFVTTLWEYPSQHYESWIDDEGRETRSSSRPAPGAHAEQGSRDYAGATPSWVIWQVLWRYTRAKDLVVDPMAGSGTTLDVARDLGRRALGYDLAPSRPDIFRADARTLPLESGVADFVFVDPPYSTHIEYSDDPACIGKLDAGDAAGEYYGAMERVIAEIHRVLKDRRYLALYVSDSNRKKSSFIPIGFELFARLREKFKPVDIIAVVRRNQKLERGNWRKAANEGNFFLRGFNYLFIMKKEDAPRPRAGTKG